MQSDGDVVSLLKSIRATMMEYQGHKDIHQTHVEVLKKFYMSYQDRKSTLEQHRDKFNALVDQASYVGASIGTNHSVVRKYLKDFATDEDKPKLEEIKLAEDKASEADDYALHGPDGWTDVIYTTFLPVRRTQNSSIST